MCKVIDLEEVREEKELDKQYKIFISLVKKYGYEYLLNDNQKRK